MSVVGSLKQGARKLLRRFTPKAQVERLLAPHLPDLICVDVGASYFPHVKWHVLLASPRTQWIAVEPNEKNLAYLRQWQWPSKPSSFTTGLSRDGGSQTLWITNVDSGSSLLEPVIPASMSRRIRNLSYFFPTRTVQIDTRTLPDVLAGRSETAPIFVKLDTQGSELSILTGAEAPIRNRRIIGIELEATLLSEPIMRGSGKFWEACQYLESLGLELLLIHPIYGPSRLGVERSRGLTFINECDAVFAVRHDIAATLSVEHRVALLAFYICNRLFEEAVLLLVEDASVGKLLSDRGCDVRQLERVLRAMA